MNEKLCGFFGKSEIDVFFCDKETKEIIWANKESLENFIGRNAKDFFGEGVFPEKQGIVSGISGGLPYRYNITEDDDCFIIEILNKNITRESFEIEAVRTHFFFETENAKEYIQRMNQNIESIENYFDKEDMYDEMGTLKNIFGDCYNLLRPYRQREEYSYYITGENLKSKIFSINDFIANNEKILKEFAGRKSAVLQFETTEEELFINVSPDRFSWVVFNTAYIIMKNINSNTHPAAKISVSSVGNEVAVKIARNDRTDLESKVIEDTSRYFKGNPFESSLDFEVLKEFCQKYDGRIIYEFSDKRLSSITIFLPIAEKDESYNLSSIKNVISDHLFSDMRVNIYEATNLEFIYR